MNSPKCALKQIDDEISQVKDIPLNKGRESNSKNRTCLIGDRGLLLINASTDSKDQIADFANNMYKRMARDQVDLTLFLRYI